MIGDGRYDLLEPNEHSEYIWSEKDRACSKHSIVTFENGSHVIYFMLDAKFVTFWSSYWSQVELRACKQ
jgi:hypothetical protein